MEAVMILVGLFYLVVVLPLEIYALIRGINVQRYNLGIAKGRRYKQGVWWRQASGLARSRANKGANFIITTVLAALGVLLAIISGSFFDGAICGYVLVNALVAANFFAAQLPIIDAEQQAASATRVAPTAAPEVSP